MKLTEIIEAADKAYPDGMVKLYFENPNGNHGDTLAKFIVLELKDTFDEEATDADQIWTAERTLSRAREELAKVQEAIEAMGR